MPIDIARVRGAELEPQAGGWGPDQVILYHMGIGAGVGRATDRRELEYTYEKDLKVLPSFAVIPVFRTLAGLARVPGFEVNFALILHGEQEVRLHRPLPVMAEVESRARITDVFDKRRAALVVLEVETRERGGAPLFSNRFSLFARGEGGFGGSAGPSDTTHPPARPPDRVVETATTPHQALLYRLSGDKNPLHADPDFAKLAGFERPILHGLCSYGIVCKAAVDALLDGEVERVAAYRARFSGVVFPGETLETSLWREGDRILAQAKARERGTSAVSHAALTLRSC